MRIVCCCKALSEVEKAVRGLEDNSSRESRRVLTTEAEAMKDLSSALERQVWRKQQWAPNLSEGRLCDTRG